MKERKKETPHVPFKDGKLEGLFQKTINYNGGRLLGDGRHTRVKFTIPMNEKGVITNLNMVRFLREVMRHYKPILEAYPPSAEADSDPRVLKTNNPNVKIHSETQGFGTEQLSQVITLFNSSEEF